MAGKKDDKPFNDMVKNLLTWAIIAVVLLSIFNHYAAVNSTPNALTYSDFLDDVRNGTISQVNIESSLNGNQGAGESGLPVVNMTNRADVHVGLCPFKRFLCHLFLDLPR